jgi:hypothetical protein
LTGSIDLMDCYIGYSEGKTMKIDKCMDHNYGENYQFAYVINHDLNQIFTTIYMTSHDRFKVIEDADGQELLATQSTSIFTKLRSVHPIPSSRQASIALALSPHLSGRLACPFSTEISRHYGLYKIVHRHQG